VVLPVPQLPVTRTVLPLGIPPFNTLSRPSIPDEHRFLVLCIGDGEPPVFSDESFTMHMIMRLSTYNCFVKFALNLHFLPFDSLKYSGHSPFSMSFNIDPSAINLSRILFAMAFLIYASYKDVKTRRVENKVWLFMSICGLGFLTIHLLLGGGIQWYQLIAIPAMIVLIYVLYQFRAIYGGADAKALMALAILTPVYPRIYEVLPLVDLGYAESTIEAMFPFMLVVLLNSVLIFLSVPIYLALLNVYRREFAFPQAFVGIKIPIEDVNKKYVWLMEKVEEGRRIIVLFPKKNRQEDVAALKEMGVGRVWVTPKIPFMIPLTVGFILSVVVGNLIFFIMWVFTGG
jgi:preflagellin peptidase FlaK